jgi:hypothetical protein
METKYGNEMADRLAKEAAQNYYVKYSRIIKSAIKKGYTERKHKKMAKSVGGNNKRRDY